MVYGMQTSDGSEEMEHKFPLGIFCPEKQAFYMFCCSQKFSAGTTQKGAFYLLSNQNLWKLLVNGKQPQKQHRIEVHQSQSMTFATRLTKHLFPKRSAKMIIPSNNKIFGEWLSPLLWIVQNFFTGVGFDSSQPRLDYQPLSGKMSPHSSPRRSLSSERIKTGPGRRRKSSLSQPRHWLNIIQLDFTQTSWFLKYILCYCISFRKMAHSVVWTGSEYEIMRNFIV